MSMFQVSDHVLKITLASDTEHGPSANSTFSFHVGADTLYLLILYDFFYIFPCVVHAKT